MGNSSIVYPIEGALDVYRYAGIDPEKYKDPSE